jgi:hypothetical protein
LQFLTDGALRNQPRLMSLCSSVLEFFGLLIYYCVLLIADFVAPAALAT